MRLFALLLSGVLLLSGCGDSSSSGGAGGDDGGTVPSVTVQAGGDPITVNPTQYCLAGEGQRYRTSPPILEVPVDTSIELRVPESVAAVLEH